MAQRKDKDDDLASVMEESRPRTSQAEARRKERRIKRQIDDLLRIDDENLFLAALLEDYGIDRNHPSFDEIMRIWRGRHG